MSSQCDFFEHKENPQISIDLLLDGWQMWKYVGEPYDALFAGGEQIISATEYLRRNCTRGGHAKAGNWFCLIFRTNVTPTNVYWGL